jgi:hypothetical protein
METNGHHTLTNPVDPRNCSITAGLVFEALLLRNQSAETCMEIRILSLIRYFTVLNWDAENSFDMLYWLP